MATSKRFGLYSYMTDTVAQIVCCGLHFSCQTKSVLRATSIMSRQKSQSGPLRLNRDKSLTSFRLVTFEVFTAVTMKNGVFWDIKPQFVLTGDTLRLHY
jgi:hypothetical protein